MLNKTVTQALIQTEPFSSHLRYAKSCVTYSSPQAFMSKSCQTKVRGPFTGAHTDSSGCLGERCEDRGRTYQEDCANQCPRSCTDLWDHVQCLQGACHPGSCHFKHQRSTACFSVSDFMSFHVFSSSLRLSVSTGTVAAGRTLCVSDWVSLWNPIRQRHAGVLPQRGAFCGL